jgi:hypothetical protein
VRWQPPSPQYPPLAEVDVPPAVDAELVGERGEIAGSDSAVGDGVCGWDLSRIDCQTTTTATARRECRDRVEPWRWAMNRSTRHTHTRHTVPPMSGLWLSPPSAGFSPFNDSRRENETPLASERRMRRRDSLFPPHRCVWILDGGRPKFQRFLVPDDVRAMHVRCACSQYYTDLN